MKNKWLIFGGTGGFGITAPCCFTPLLVILLSSIGLAGVIAYLDYALFPLMVVFVIVLGFGIYRIKSSKDCCETKGE